MVILDRHGRCFHDRFYWAHHEVTTSDIMNLKQKVDEYVAYFIEMLKTNDKNVQFNFMM